MSSVPKGKQKPSKQEFDSIYYQIHDEAVDAIELKFHAKADVAEKNAGYIKTASDALMQSVFDMIFHIKVANALYPTTPEELSERRIEQEKAIGICFDILTIYELAMHKLKVKEDLCAGNLKTVRHEINAIKAWRTSDNKRYRNLK